MATLVRCGLVAWGLVSFAQGAGLSFFIHGDASGYQTLFVELTYCSVLLGAVLSFASNILSVAFLAFSAVAAVAMLYAAHLPGLSGRFAPIFLADILLRPGLAAVTAFAAALCDPRAAWLDAVIRREWRYMRQL